jgi:ABC-2 type transport system ATP-binding protein
MLDEQRELAINCRGLYKNFRYYEKSSGVLGSVRSLWHRKFLLKQAVQAFDLQVAPGEIVGLLGPNGAGKTTLMKMLTGIIVPSGGQCQVAGFVPAERSLEFRRRIALVMGQKSQLWWDIPAKDSFLLLQAYYELDEQRFQARLAELAEILDVTRLLHVHVRKLSLGERMKMELIACLLHDPKVIFLDEPSIGLDIVAQKKIREFILEYHRQFKPTIILTSHYMADVSALCSRIVLIIDGQRKFDGPMSHFQNLLGEEKNLTLVLSSPLSSEQLEALAAFSPRWLDPTLELRVPANSLRQDLSKLLRDLPIVDLQTEKLPIERVMETLLTQPGFLASRAQLEQSRP